MNNNKNYNVSYKKILLIFSITLIIIIALAALFYVNLNKDTSKKVRGTVKYVGDDYIILSNKNNDNEYLIDIDDVDIKDGCEVGDELSLTIDKIKNNKEPIEAEAKNVKVISRAKKKEETIIKKNDDNNVDSNKNSITNNNTNTTNDNNTNTNTQSNNIGTEDNIVSYFNSVNSEIDKSSTTKTLSNSAKSGFINIVDFLFYGKTIGGKTFDELSTETKLKVLKLGISIDKKIDNKFPSYKSTLSSKYQNVKSQAVSKYLDKTVDICSRNEDTCQSAREGLTELKNNFSITWSFIKDISGVGISKLKAWYEIWRQS